jgi:hypothetical protein
VGTAPLASGLRVNAGKVRVAVSLGDRQRTETVELAGGDSREVVVELPPEPPRPVDPAPPPPVPPAPPAPRGVGGAVIATWSITGVLTLGWGGLALAAVAASNDLASKRRVLGTTTTDLESAASNARGLALGADVVLGVAGASAIVATVVTALDRRPAATALGGVRLGYVGPTPSGWMVAGTF